VRFLIVMITEGDKQNGRTTELHGRCVSLVRCFQRSTRQNFIDRTTERQNYNEGGGSPGLNGRRAAHPAPRISNRTPIGNCPTLPYLAPACYNGTRPN